MTTFAIYAAFLAIVVLAVLRRPSVAVAAYLCTFGLEQWAQAKSEFFFRHQSLTNFVTASVLIFALLVRAMRAEPFLRGWPRHFWVTLALFTWSLCSIFWALNPEWARDNWLKFAPYLAVTIVLMPLTVGSLADLRAALLMTLTLGLAVLALLLVDAQWSQREVELQKSAFVASIVGTRGNPLAIASMAGWIALIGLLMNFSGASAIWKWLRWLLVALGIIVAVRSGSRGQLFAMGIAAMVFLPYARPLFSSPRALLGVVMAVGVAIAIFVFTLDPTRIEARRWDASEFITDYQRSRIGTSLQVLAYWWNHGSPANWLIGLGTSASFDEKVLGFYPHLVMIETLVELGLVGFALIWLVPIFVLRTLVQAFPVVREHPEYRGLFATMGALFLFETILSFKQGSLLGTWFAFGFAVILGRMHLWLAQEQAVAASAYGEDLPLYGQLAGDRAAAF